MKRHHKTNVDDLAAIPDARGLTLVHDLHCFQAYLQALQSCSSLQSVYLGVLSRELHGFSWYTSVCEATSSARF